MINMPGSPEMMVILLVALVFLGPKELPKVMRTIGNVMAEVRKVSSGFQSEIKNAMDSITDTGSSKSPGAKPQSGTMTAVATPTEPLVDDAPTGDQEVVARNDLSADGAPVDVLTSGDGTPTGPVTTPSSAPADRAAG